MRLIRFIVLLVFTPLMLYAEGKEVGVVSDLEGDVSIVLDLVEKRASVGMLVERGMKIVTKEQSRVKIMMMDDTLLVIAPKTELSIDEYLVDFEKRSRRSLLGLLRGKVLFYVNKAFANPQSKFEVKTKTAVAGVRGTKFIMESGEGDFVGVLNGEVEIIGGEMSRLVGAGRCAASRNGFLIADFDRDLIEQYQGEFKIKRGKTEVAMLTGGTRMSGESLLGFQAERDLFLTGTGESVCSFDMSQAADRGDTYSKDEGEGGKGGGNVCGCGGGGSVDTEGGDTGDFYSGENVDVTVGGSLNLRIRVMLPFAFLRR